MGNVTGSGSIPSIVGRVGDTDMLSQRWQKALDAIKNFGEAVQELDIDFDEEDEDG